jgi:hypothetical protein
VLELDAQTIGAQRIEYAQGSLDDLPADTIARKDSDLV